MEDLEGVLADTDAGTDAAETLAHERVERIDDLRRMLPAPTAEKVSRGFWSRIVERELGVPVVTIDEFIETIKKSPQHRYLYHFTDEANFDSIGVKGLVSKATMRAENWCPVAPGGNALSWSLDTYRGIDHDVSLCLTQNHSMKFFAERDGRLKNARYLAISPDILKTEGVRIAFGIANANGVKILPLAQSLEELDTEVLYSWTNWLDPVIQARLRVVERIEVLIPNAVPRPLIVGVC